MNKSKTALILVLILCIALTLSACTGGKTSGADTSGSNSTTESAAETENTSAEEPSASETTAELIDTSDKTIMTIDVPADTPVADSNGEIPGADAVSDIARQTVIFGNYYQDSAGAELTPVEWIVLDEQDGYTLLMTKQIIASMGWVNEGRNDITWAETDLRRWLDNEFYNTAFSEEERENMALFRATQPQNPRYDTPAGEETIDTVSLLSYQELIKYMPTDLERKTKPTDYAAKQGCYLNPDGDSAWWLRSPGPTATVPEHLASWGNLGARTHYIDDYTIGVRPVIWVSTEYLGSVN